jgi:hypothetical protein
MLLITKHAHAELGARHVRETEDTAETLILLGIVVLYANKQGVNNCMVEKCHHETQLTQYLEGNLELDSLREFALLVRSVFEHALDGFSECFATDLTTRDQCNAKRSNQG